MCWNYDNIRKQSLFDKILFHKCDQVWEAPLYMYMATAAARFSDINWHKLHVTGNTIRSQIYWKTDKWSLISIYIYFSRSELVYDIDVELCQECIKAIGKIAQALPKAAEYCIDTLLSFLSCETESITAQTLIVVRGQYNW